MKFAFVIAALFAASAIAAPCGRKHVDDVADVTDVTDAPVDVPAAEPPVSDADAEDERKTSVPDSDEKSQTAVINNNSPGSPSHGSLVNVDASNLLAGGVLSRTENNIKQH